MLPVRAIQGELFAALDQVGRAILIAPTGSGKTTQAPQMLLGQNYPGRIVVLQPRRLAVRLVAHRVAQEVGSPLGELVGYQTRHERVLSARTKLLFMTEGLLLRQLQSSPTLPDVSAVLLDEFHERNLAADLLLGLLRNLHHKARPDLKLLVMSATLEAERVSAHIDCPILNAPGRAFPVDISYAAAAKPAPPWDLAAGALRDLLKTQPAGDVLVFMPGAFEIRRTMEACSRVLTAGDHVTVHALHGSLPPREQDAAVAPAAPGTRKVIVATNVAETSITIEGVRHVIDAGLARIHRFDPRRGLNVLRTEPISQASATQRAGRAGRTAPGTCHRLWPKSHDPGRPISTEPEILRLDLAEPLLQLRSMGVADARTFPWLDPPAEDALQRAHGELVMLGALDEAGALTRLGQRMAAFPLHPRLARMLIEAAERGCLGRALLWAALASERDIVTGDLPADLREFSESEPASDLLARERAFDAAERARFATSTCRALGLDPGACRELASTRRLLENVARRADLALDGRGDTVDLITCLLVAFPDHVALCTDVRNRRCQLPGHKRVMLDRASTIRRPGLIIALDVRELARGGQADTVLALASEVDEAQLREAHPARMQHRKRIEWNAERQAVDEIEEALYDELPLEVTRRPAPPDAAADLLVEKIQSKEIDLPLWNDKVEAWLARTRCVADWFPERHPVRYDEQDVGVILHELVTGANSAKQVRGKPVLDALRNALSWEDQQFVEKMAPPDITLPTGRRMKLEYQPGQPPRGRAKIQDLFGLTQTPRIAQGRVPIVLEILAPNYRPIQITEDLANFWQTLYPQIKPALSRRYPKHEWR